MWFWISVHIVRHVDIIIQGLCTATVYCKIYFTVRRHVNQMQNLQIQVEQNSQMESAVRQKKTAIRMFYVYLVFLVCYLPNYFVLIVSISSALTVHLNTMSSVYIWLYLFILQLLNSCINPVIYCWKMRNVRSGCSLILLETIIYTSFLLAVRYSYKYLSRHYNNWVQVTSVYRL